MNCPILNLFTKCSCCGWMICEFCVQLTIAVIAIAFGGLSAWKPKKAIDIQIALYLPFNWTHLQKFPKKICTRVQ
ncbi:MAG: hypothetical protein KJ706_08470 [Candidatus Omnitrophica bacterium]|nr:hypothetical protein [Candidatus Omnitrophota bacterium]